MKKHLTTEEEFRESKFSREGYIVITDDTKNTIHMPNCPDVDIANVREKVVNNNDQHGRYYFVDDLVAGTEELNAQKCLNCRPK